MEKRYEKWEKGKGKEKKGGECTPAAIAAPVGLVRCRACVRGQTGEAGYARRLRSSGTRVHAARRRGRKEREKKRRGEIRGDDRNGRSRVGDMRPRDARWDGGGKKRSTVNGEKGWNDK
jgi:hypothetical protein